jgi:RNA:NAD 2'-phosphotransferase (TPT1/KptA family)
MGVLGKAETKEDYDRAVSTIQQRFPGHRVELTSETANKKKERMDGLRQRAYETRKKAGVDDTIRREIHEETQARKAEKAAAAPAPAGGAS